MKTKILLLSLMTSFFVAQIHGQNRTRINAMSNEVSDNLDLRAVTDIFGDSRNLQDFERRLNDPELQISNLDLNYDNEVDYLRVIETVDYNTHLIIIQSVLDRDVYQDVATIEVEKDRYNNIYVQVVGNEYMYGSNYIYEPVYYSTPIIYASLWTYNYRPYVSNWCWNSYPSYYYAWNPFPVYRYRNNIQLSLNFNNNYNYVTSRRSNQAVILYNSRRSNGYERQHPDYGFSRRNTSVSNRYELEQRRNSRTISSRNETAYSKNRNNSSREAANGRTENQRNYSQNRATPSRETTPQRSESKRSHTQNSTTPVRQTTPQRNYSQNRTIPLRETAPQRTESKTANTPNRITESRQSSNQRDNSQKRANSTRENTTQKTENQRVNPSSKTEQNSSSRDNNRRS